MVLYRIAAIGVALAAGLVLTGCAPSSVPNDSDSTAVPPSATAETPMPTESPAEDSGSTAGAYVEYTDGAIEATAGPKVLFFHASWCPQCRQLDEQLIAEGAPDGLTVFKVDFDSRTDLRQQYGVTLQTTVVFVDDSGALISSSVLYDDPSIESLLAAQP